MLSPRVRLLSFFAGGQALCLATGLWLQCGLLNAIDTRMAEARAEGSDAASLLLERRLVFPLTFLWIAGLQTVGCWLLLTRVVGQQSRKEQQSQEETLRTTRELVRTRDAVIFGLAKLAESRDPDTGHHLERIALYSTRIAQALRRHPKYQGVVTQQFVRMIGISSALHDIGKVGVEDAVLLKPGSLTEAERRRIQVHAALGGDCIRQIERRLGNSTFLQMAREIALYHHERWDGSGYPHGLAGEDIPLAARVVAIADVYDALSVKRVYKDAYPHAICVEKIRREAGRQFDPDLVEVFLSIAPQIAEVSSRLSDQNQDDPAAAAVMRGLQRMTPEQEQLLSQALMTDSDRVPVDSRN
ncbi:MAG: HD domain-containing protein [Planctomyces sp.]|nr:HD domain-containing protein [Planctomyces sp.]